MPSLAKTAAALSAIATVLLVAMALTLSVYLHSIDSTTFVDTVATQEVTR